MRWRCVPRWPAVPVAGRVAASILMLRRFGCLVLFAQTSTVQCLKINRTRTRHATHPPPVPGWGGMLKGVVVEPLPNGPWTGGGTKVPIPYDDDW